MMIKNKWDQWYLVLIGSMYLVLSASLSLSIPSFEKRLEKDSSAYIEPLTCFEQHGTLIPPDQQVCNSYVGIGYSLFLIIVRQLCGAHYNAIIFVQIMLALLSIFLIFKSCILKIDYTTKL